MDQIKRRDAGIAYIADKEVMEQQKRARKLTQELNTVDRSDFEKIEKITTFERFCFKLERVCPKSNASAF